VSIYQGKLGSGRGGKLKGFLERINRGRKGYQRQYGENLLKTKSKKTGKEQQT